MKKVLSIALAIVMLLSMSVTALAAEIESPVSETIIGGYEFSDNARASSVPTSFYNLGGDNNYTATLIDLAANRGSYTMYYFATGTGNIYCKCDLERSGTTTNKDRELTIYLYEKATAYSAGVLIDTKTVSFSDAEVTSRKLFTGLDSNKFYYIRFFNTSADSASSSMDISGSILVDDSYN